MNQCSTYLPAENDDAAIELAFGMLMESHDEGCPDVYGGRISIFGMTIVRDCKI
jgi:hypothetical protein